MHYIKLLLSRLNLTPTNEVIVILNDPDYEQTIYNKVLSHSYGIFQISKFHQKGELTLIYNVLIKGDKKELIHSLMSIRPVIKVSINNK